MHVTCQNCQGHYQVPDRLFGSGGRAVRCGECGSDWWQESRELVAAGRSVVEEGVRQTRMLVIYAGNRWREEDHRFTSFFDGVSSRFSARSDMQMRSSQRFERLSARRENRLRDNAVVEAEFSEVRSYRSLRRWCRFWLPRSTIVGLMAASVALVYYAA